MSHKNSSISFKSSELITFIREKILSEIFEFENVTDELEKLLKYDQNYLIIDDDFTKKLIEDLDIAGNNLLLTKKNSLKTDFLENTDNREHSPKNDNNFRKTRGASEDKKETWKNFNPFSEPLKSAHNQEFQEEISNINLSSDSHQDSKIRNFHKFDYFNSTNKNKLSPLNEGQIKLLFKDFICDDLMDNSHLDFQCKLKNGIYSQDFYQNIYNKYNGLSESLANKRKNVCLKLLNILKKIVPLINIASCYRH